MKVEVLTQDLPAPHERWIRLPARGPCPFCGLTRAHLYQLINEAKIKSACLRKPGALKGVRLIWLPSVLDYIERHVDPRWRELTNESLHDDSNPDQRH